MEEVCDDRLIPLQVLVPSFLSCFFDWLIFTFLELHIRLLSFSEEVLAHKVENSTDALMGVMLSVPFEIWRILTEHALEEIRSTAA